MRQHISMLLLALCLLFNQATAQVTSRKTTEGQNPTEANFKMAPSAPQMAPAPLSSEPMTLPFADLNEPTHLRACEGEEEEDNEEVQEIKAEMALMRPIEEAGLGKIANPFEPSATFNPLLAPSLVSSFNATHVGSGNPPDNTMAISNGGYIITSVNSRVAVYNTAGGVIGQWDLYTFFNGAGAGVVNDFFDPNVIYDPGQDRFVFTCCVGRTTANSRILVAFSKTNNPSGGWWCYYLTGNPLNNSCWLDYPRIGVSTVEVFVTGNLYNNAGNYNNSVIYQIPKAAGYAGSSLPWQYWHSLSGSPFAITPVSSGNNANYGPAFYFVSHNTGSGSATKLYRITDQMSAASETIVYNSVASPAYIIGANASQSGTTEKLDVGDSRAISAFYLNGLIHYVFAGAVSGTTFNRIHYHRLNPTSLTVTSKQVFTTGWDLVYPSLAWAGTVTTDKSVLISFQFSNSANFPGVGAVSIDDAMNTSASWISCGWGTGYVNLGSAASSRWGDYTGICRRRNSSPARVWGSASFGNTAHNWTDKVFELGTTAFAADNEDRSAGTSDLTEIALYPNPAQENTTISLHQATEGDLSVQVFNLAGGLVMEKQKSQASAGAHQFILDTQTLNAGTYVVRVSANNRFIQHEKLVVVH